MWNSGSSRKNLFIMGFAIVGAFIFFSKKATQGRLISEEVAKRIAVESLEAKKEDYHIPSDADITPTNFCRLERRVFEPYEWHVGIKVETRQGKIDLWRVDVHPFEGLITGVVRTPTGYEGDTPDVLYVSPDHYVEEE